MQLFDFDIRLWQISLGPDRSRERLAQNRWSER